MTRGLRMFGLILHVVSSVGWFGAAAGFLAIALYARTVGDVQSVHAIGVAISILATFVIVPFAGASLVTGVVLSVASPWGLFRHYWIRVKLVLTMFATVALLREMPRIMSISGAVMPSRVGLEAAEAKMISHAVGGLVMLALITLFAVCKPRSVGQFLPRSLRARCHESAARLVRGVAVVVGMREARKRVGILKRGKKMPSLDRR